MDANRVDEFLRTLSVAVARRSRRALIPVGIVGGLAAFGMTNMDAKRRQRRPHGTQAQTKKKRKKTCPLCPSPPGCPTCPAPPARMECLGPKDTSQTATRRYAQTFTATRTASITSADVQIGTVPAGTDFTVEIRSVDANGAPTTTVLGSGQILDVPLTTSVFRTFTAIFNPVIPLVEGTRYALVLADQTNSGYSAALRTGNACAGSLFTDPAANGTFTPQADKDLIYAIDR